MITTKHLGSLAVAVTVGAAVAVSVGAGTASATAAQSPTWSYVGTFQTKDRCDEAAGAYRGRPDTSEYRCISNGNPAGHQEGTWSLYNLRY